MKNKHVKQMMLDTGSLDIEKLIRIYLENSYKSLLKRKCKFNLETQKRIQQATHNVMNGAIKRGWITFPKFEYDIEKVDDRKYTLNIYSNTGFDNLRNDTPFKGFEEE